MARVSVDECVFFFTIMSCEEEDPGKRVRELRVVLTPLTGVECKVYVERLKKRKAEKVKEAKRSVVLTPLTGVECEACRSEGSET